MWVVAQMLITRFSERASADGWVLDFVEDDEFALFARDRDSGIRAEIGLDLSRREFGLSLNPGVSVRHVQVSDLAARFFGLERGAAQVGESLSDLLWRGGRGEGVMWTIDTAGDIDPVIDQILTDVREFGVSIFSEFDSLAKIVEKMEKSAKIALDFGQLAVAYMFIDESAKMQSALSKIQEISTSKSLLVSAQAQRFLSEFNRYFRLS